MVGKLLCPLVCAADREMIEAAQIWPSMRMIIMMWRKRTRGGWWWCFHKIMTILIWMLVWSPTDLIKRQICLVSLRQWRLLEISQDVISRTEQSIWWKAINRGTVYLAYLSHPAPPLSHFLSTYQQLSYRPIFDHSHATSVDRSIMYWALQCWQTCRQLVMFYVLVKVVFIHPAKTKSTRGLKGPN